MKASLLPGIVRRSGTVLASCLALGACATAMAAPIGAEDPATPAADPYELALRWTLASLTPRPPMLAAPAEAARYGAASYGAPHLPPDAGVPDPVGYALMGLLLLGAGLAARRAARPQRGLSKKT